MPHSPLPAAVTTAAFPLAGPPGSIIHSLADDQVMGEASIGKEVTAPGGKALGTVDDVLLKQNGKLVGLPNKNGGVLGFGDKMVAAAWRDVGTDSATLDISPDDMEQAPEFAPGARRAAGSEGMAEPPAATTGSRGSSGFRTSE